MPIKVVIADDHYLVREGVRRLLETEPELEVAAVCEDFDSLLAAVEAERPDVAVLDRRLVDLTGEQVLNAVGRDGLGIRVVMIAAEPEPGLVYSAIENGAAGYLTHDADAGELCDAVAAVARGGIVLAPQVQAGIAGEIRLRADYDRPFLSEREREIHRRGLVVGHAEHDRQQHRHAGGKLHRHQPPRRGTPARTDDGDQQRRQQRDHGDEPGVQASHSASLCGSPPRTAWNSTVVPPGSARTTKPAQRALPPPSIPRFRADRSCCPGC